jgi:hypothetical protein
MADASPRTVQLTVGALALRHWFAFALQLVLVAGLFSTAARADESPPALKPPVDRAELEPEEVARRFFVALLTKDKPLIEQYILPEEHSEVLWQGPRVSETTRRAAHKQVEAMQFRRLKPGDVVTAANGKKYTIEERQVNAERVLLLPTGFHFPFALVKHPDGWKVKATTMIAARLEAQNEKSAK